MYFLIILFIVPVFYPVQPISAPGSSPLPSRGRVRDVGMVGSHWGNIGIFMRSLSVALVVIRLFLLGFQGMDPCTDINRSMKMLSVLQV